MRHSEGLPDCENKHSKVVMLNLYETLVLLTVVILHERDPNQIKHYLVKTYFDNGEEQLWNEIVEFSKLSWEQISFQI